jgi:hypothetical protein
MVAWPNAGAGTADVVLDCRPRLRRDRPSSSLFARSLAPGGALVTAVS